MGVAACLGASRGRVVRRRLGRRGVDGNPGELGNEGPGGGAPTRRPAARNSRDVARGSIHDARRYSVFGATIGLFREIASGFRRPVFAPPREDAELGSMRVGGVIVVSPALSQHGRPARGRRKMNEHRVSSRGTVNKRHLTLSLLRPMVPHGSGVQPRGGEVSGQIRNVGFAPRRCRWRHRCGLARDELDR